MDSNTELKILRQEEEQLKARIEEVRKLINETNEKIIFESWGVKVGLMVRDNTGKEGRVSRVKSFGTGKPWVTFKPRKKCGEISKRDIFIGQRWELI